jgi:SAM-dependent methyltransferase
VSDAGSAERSFYGPDQAWIHDVRFGDLAASAADFVIERLRDAGLERGTVVDLGCGSGILAARLLAAGYDVLGIDLSSAMIAIARERAPAATFRVGSVHDEPLPDGVVAVTAIGEVLGYATDPRAGLDAFARLATRAHAALVPGGIFTCDLATPGRYGSDRTAVRLHDDDSWFLGMQAAESEDGTRLDRHITIFRRDETEPERWRRIVEHHVVRLQRPEDLVAALAAAGFTVEERRAFAAASEHTPVEGWVVLVGTRSARGAAAQPLR